MFFDKRTVACALTLVLLNSIAYAEDANPAPAAAGEYQFLEGLELATPLNKGTLARFSRVGNVEPGVYSVDVYVNRSLQSRMDVRFANNDGAQATPFFTPAELLRFGIKADALQEKSGVEEGIALQAAVPGATFRFDLAALKLDIEVPQALLDQRARDAIDPSTYDAGTSIGFINYSASQYYSATSLGSSSATYVSTVGGINAGLWRLRQQGALTYDDRNGAKWNPVRTYAKRALPTLRSELSVGENFTSGMFFSGLGYQGVEISSDERMLPESQRGYAPVIRGTAKTNAQVVVSQKGREIYRTAVVPGAFEINDLYPTSYNGDLDVMIIEADGTRSQFSVPFSAVPDSMRPGFSRYSLTLGRTRDSASKDFFADAIYQRGLTNSLTLNTGLRVARGYQSLALGATQASMLGAVGLNLNYSNADVGRDASTRGWMANLSYSRTFQNTGTTFSLASYRYSTTGYRDFADVQSERKTGGQAYGNDGAISASYRQRSRFDVALSQQLGSAGSVYLSGLTQNYYDGRRRLTQFQMGYSAMLPGDISLNIAIQRQRTTAARSELPWEKASASDSSIMVSLSIPLGAKTGNRPNLSGTMMRSGGTDSYQTSLTGTLEGERNVNYGVDLSRTTGGGQQSISGNLSSRFADANVSVNVSKGADYWQAAATARGAVAVHAGGITLGPYLGDTFGLIEAKGAKGAKVFNGQGAEIDSNGYALVPALAPYRRNTIGLTGEGLSSKAELVDGQRVVVPYAGAAVKLQFKTRQGNALLIRATRKDGAPIPMGADVLDEKGVVIGIVGQGSQAYVRSDRPQGLLVMRWGDDAADQCQLRYDTQGKDLSQPLVRLNGRCVSPPDGGREIYAGASSSTKAVQ